MRAASALLLAAVAFTLPACGDSAAGDSPTPATSGRLTVRIVGVGGPAPGAKTYLQGTVTVENEQGKRWRLRIRDAQEGAYLDLPFGTYTVHPTLRNVYCVKDYVALSAGRPSNSSEPICSIR